MILFCVVSWGLTMICLQFHQRYPQPSWTDSPLLWERWVFLSFCLQYQSPRIYIKFEQRDPNAGSVHCTCTCIPAGHITYLYKYLIFNCAVSNIFDSLLLKTCTCTCTSLHVYKFNNNNNNNNNNNS